MALSGFCTTCQRTVYIEEGNTATCPVCSSPLVEAVDAADDEEEPSSTTSD